MSITPLPPTFDQAEAAGFDGTLRTSTSYEMIERWKDPIVDAHGQPARSEYVENYWLPVIGPTGLLILRRLDQLIGDRDTMPVDLSAMAESMGLSYRVDKETPFGRALKRLEMFGLAHRHATVTHVRLMVPTVPDRYSKRWSQDLQDRHRGALLDLYAAAA